MSTGLRNALGIWRARNARSGGDNAYVVYLVVMVAITAFAPIARALWLSATSTEGLALLVAATSPTSVVLMLAGLWTGALIIGRDRGPALLPLVPLYVFGTSDLKRSTVFGGPLVRNGVLLSATSTAVAGFAGAALWSQGLFDAHAAIALAAVGALAGIIATVAWLVGQVLPRASVIIGLGIVALGACGFGGLRLGVSALAAIAAVLIVLVPTLLHRLSLATLTAQAVRWESATVFTSGLDFAAAASTYQGRPSVGRQLRAVRPGRSLATVFLRRDAIGAIRTPGRLAVGVMALAVAGALMSFAFAPGAPAVLLGAAAGLVLFAGLGPLSDGIRHAVSVAADLPLYGVSDEALVALHALFPLALLIVVLVVAVTGAALLLGTSMWAPLVASFSLGVMALLARVNTALKGMLPTALLTPMPTPAGDVSILFQLVWAVDGLIIVSVAGIAAALMLQTPVFLGGAVLTIVGIGLTRWRNRR